MAAKKPTAKPLSASVKAAWAMGRVNSFVSGKGGARKADADIAKKKPTKRKK